MSPADSSTTAAGGSASSATPSLDEPGEGTGTSWLSTIAPIAVIVVVGAALRISEFEQSLFADEMWSYVGATQPSLGGVLDFVRSDEEITPPLFTLVAWLSAKVGDPTVMVRLPSLLAGIATIPLVYALGLRTLGRRVALIAAALAALSPFLAWYTIEVRGYSLAVAFVCASTLCLLLAVEGNRARWWVAYAVFSCLAMYTHYTSAYVLIAQIGWGLWFFPEVRIRLAAANAAAALAYLPWLPGFLEDLDSPTQGTIGALAPFSLHNFADFTARFAAGHPAVPLGSFWGTWPLVALASGIAIAIAGLIVSRFRQPSAAEETPERSRAVILFVMLGLAAPVGIALASLLGDDMFLPRNLVTSLPALLLALAVLLDSGPPAFRAVAVTLVLGVFTLGAVRNTEGPWQRPAFRDAGAFIDEAAAPGDVVLDVTASSLGATPGGPLPPPAQTLDINLDEPHEVIDLLVPSDGARALREASGHRLFLVGDPFFMAGARGQLELDQSTAVEVREYEGIVQELVEVYDIPASERP